MGDVYTSFADEQPVTIHVGHSRQITGILKWCCDGRIGVHFDAPLSVSDVLTEMSTRSVDGLISRAPRLQIRCAAQMVIGEEIRLVEVEDISQRGLRVRAPFMQVNQEVTIQLDGLDRRKAIVRWAQAGTAGLNFIRPLGFEQLAQWTVEQQARSRSNDELAGPPPFDFVRGWQVQVIS